MEYLDTSVLGSLKEILGDDVYDITGLYAENLENDILQLSVSLASGEWATLRRQAHSIKGSSSNMGANELARVSGLIEKLALAEDAAGIAPLLAQLPELGQLTLAALDAGGFLPAKAS